MYLVGSFHPHKTDAQRLLEQLITERQRLVTDTEVLQEILHRYAAINRRDVIQPAFSTLLTIVEEVFPVDLPAVQRGKEILLGHPQLLARDAIHLAVMEQQGIDKILSFDHAFDDFPGISRLH